MNTVISTYAATRQTLARIGAYTAIISSVLMLAGAGFMFSTGTDLWLALRDGDMAGYLSAAGAVKTTYVLNTTFWIMGILIMGGAGNILVSLSEDRPLPAIFAYHCFRTAVPLAIVAFLTMLAVVWQIAPDTSETGVSLAGAIGWIGARADDIATALMLGGGPFFLARAARGAWMPRWLVIWGYAAGTVGLLSLLVLYSGPLSAFGIFIVPVGVGWLIATGVVLLRRQVID